MHRADALARGAFERLYSDRQIVLLNLDRIYQNGGGAHCATHFVADSALEISEMIG
ncbi:hypothetical protein U91I_00576 [alpha proteobacterium U9-1i]|nr:hypothetical protein U91I_00576 [alpha proteobacterium U9-1i]